MKIQKIEIKGWRSFDNSKGIVLDNLKRINILIGTNNSGKSNVGKYFLFLKNILKEKPLTKESDIKENYANFNCIDKEINNSDTWSWLGENIDCSVKVSYQKDTWILGKPHFPDIYNLSFPDSQFKNIELKIENNKKENKNYFCVMHGIYNSPLIEKSDKIKPKVIEDVCRDKINTNELIYKDYKNHMLHISDSIKYWKEFYESLVFIDPIRHYERKANATIQDFYFEGSEIKKQLLDIQSNDKAKWRKFEKKINQWLEDLLNETIKFRLESNDFAFIIYRAGEEITSDFNQVGTGVSQLFMVLSYLHLNQEKELNVFIDEPEANLHPEAVKKLIHIFEHDFKNHAFFITTHSSILIDQVNSDWSIHRVFRKKEEATEILPCNSIVQKYEVLDSLGIRASQLLQSNLIIWVEGPSDRIYIKKWIEDIATEQKITFEEGKHFSFLMYGGSNLSSHTILSEDSDYIDILCTSRYSIIVCDSDYKDSQYEIDNNLKPRVKEILERLKIVKEQEIGDEKQLDDYVIFWITAGRETENYVPKELFQEILSTSQFKKVRFNNDEKSENVEIEMSLIDSIDFDKYEAFDYFFSKMYKFEDDTKEISDKQRSKIAQHYSNKKVDISKEVVKNWKDEYYKKLDLREKIEEIVSLIKTANGI